MKNPTASQAFVSLINKEKKFKETEILLNGLYEGKKDPNEKINIYATQPIFFLGNGILYWDKKHFTDSSHLAKYLSLYPKDKFGMRNWGTYEVINDTIKVIIFEQFNKHNASLYVYKECYYRGIIKANKIEDWRMVDPFPKVDEEFNENLVARRRGVDLSFKYFPAKVNIDSNTAWINDYRSNSLK